MLTEQELSELGELQYQRDSLPPSRAARLAQLEAKVSKEPDPSTAGNKFVSNFSPTMGVLTSSTPKTLTPTGPTAQAEIEKSKPPTSPALTPEQQAADKKAKEDAAKKGKAIDLPEAMDGLIRQMNSLPAEVQGKFKTQMDGINTTIANLNDGYQRDQEAAKGETEKKKNRAEWASIASLLAKNIVGYAAALNGVNPNAMAYQTTDWEKHTQGLNDELNMNLGNLRDSMKMKVEAQLGQKKDLQNNIDDTFKGRMEALRTKAGMLSDQARFEQQSKLAGEEASRKAQEGAAGTETVTVKPLDLKGVFEKQGKEKEDDFRNRVIAFAQAKGVPQSKIDEILKDAQGWFDFGKPNPNVGDIQAALTEAINKATGGVQRTISTKRKLASGQTVEENREDIPALGGQPAAPVVQSKPGFKRMQTPAGIKFIPDAAVAAALKDGSTLLE